MRFFTFTYLCVTVTFRLPYSLQQLRTESEEGKNLFYKKWRKKKMAKALKRKLLFATIFLLILLSFSAHTSLIPNVHAAEATSQEKGLSILTNVVSLDLSKYAVTAKEYPQNYNSSYLGVVPQEDVGYDLSSEGSRVKVLCTFANSRLQMIHVLENAGSPHVSKIAANSLDLAENFLSNYLAHTADSLYGELKSTLEDVDASKNFTRTSGNTQLEVTAINGYTTFKWTYASNGAIAPSKFVSLGFNNEFLTCFVDNWQFYNIGSTSVNLSEKEAKAIALETAKAYNWSLKLDADTLDVKNFNESNVRWTALIFDDSLGAGKARNENVLTVYPVWRVGIALDKWYGNMYGIEVDIWADTKQVRRIQEAWSTMPPPAEIPTSNTTTISGTSMQTSVVTEGDSDLAIWIALPTFAVTTIGTTSVWMFRKRKSQRYRQPKPRSLKTGRTLLCILKLSTVLLAPIATVNATTRAGIIWGSESTGAGYYPNSWRKNSTEIDWQRSIASTITNYFYQGGYDAYERQGNPDSNKANILSDLLYYQSTHDCVAVVDFDHGIGRTDYQMAPNEWHYMFEDNNGTIVGAYPGNPAPGNGVYDMDIFLNTTAGKVFFAFINTCMSANTSDWQHMPDGTWWYSAQGIISGTNRARGLPFAWTHRTVVDKNTQGFTTSLNMSIDGYNEPDDGSQCYIGFPWGAASLMQRVPYNYGSEYHLWVGRFFDYALRYDMSVNMAVDHASWQTWGACFGGNCPLRTGFQAYWWNPGDGAWPRADSTMAIYGNGNIRLRYFTPGWNDNFNDNSMDTSKWEKLEANGATANETTGQLAVTVPGGSGQAQAGYVTKYAYNVKDCKATITVSEFNDLDEMILQICTTKTKSSDPFDENNWYRILKARYDSNVYVQNRINGGLSTKLVTGWVSATGELTIDICDGSIAFYENEVLRYSEPYALPSYNCYIYAFTSTLRSRANGTDKFNNFALAATPSFWDYFDDAGNYYGWTNLSGTWTVQNGKLQTSQTGSMIKTYKQFTINRHVRVTLKTNNNGSDHWNTAWLIAKRTADWNNAVFGLIDTNGDIELSVIRNGEKDMYGNASGLSPLQTHAIDISIIGTRARMWVDGTLYIDVTNSKFVEFGGSVALYTDYSTGEFDNVVVIED
jgi:hypothetical protein